MDNLNFSLEFAGYWRYKRKGSVPKDPGLYCVYTCIYSGKRKSCSLQKLVYIGASEDVRACIADHGRLDDWESHIDTGEELCFSFAPAGLETLERLAAAMIFKHKPPENTVFKDSFPFDPTTLTLSGEAGFLSKSFTV